MKFSRTVLWRTALAACSVLGFASLRSAHAASPDTLSLAGTWRFELDGADAGEGQQWATRVLPQKVKLPGDLAEQGIGDRPSLATKWVGSVQSPWWTDPQYAPYTNSEHFKFPFWLTPEHRYMGPAWYQRNVEVPARWTQKRLVLFLERPHWETRVWLDGKLMGTNNALGTPHEYELGILKPGTHVLTIRVDNRLVVDVGVNSHSVSDHTQGNWNGIEGRLELRATPLVWLEDVQVYPDPSASAFRVKGKIGNASGQAGNGPVAVSVTPRTGKAATATATLSARWDAQGGAFAGELKPKGELLKWDEFNPNLYEVAATLGEHRVSVVTGFREFATEGTQFTINGRKTFIRGTLECAIFPKTGHPPTDVESWKKVLKAARAHGLNNLRFHSWCPPEAAFIAADEMGFYYQVECSSWANQSTTIGDGKPIDRWIYEEADRMLKYYGNHPSFTLMPYGNEPGGKKSNEFLAKWVEHYRGQDSRRLYTSGSGWPQLPVNQFHVTPDPRIQSWGGGVGSRINALPPETVTDYREYIRQRSVPVISHEIGQWCVYPNFEEMRKYTGYLKPRNFEIFRDQLRANHMGDLSKQFLLASGKLQALCYKEDIESALRTPGMGGFQLLDLHDFPGQGTALVGVLDPFWEEKGYVSPREYSRFCGPVVPLARLRKRIFTVDEQFHATIEVANFGPTPLRNVVAEWKLAGKDGAIWASGNLSPQTVEVGNGFTLGELRTSLDKIRVPAQGKLVVRLKGTPIENDWDIWVYAAPRSAPMTAGITVASALDDQTLSVLKGGGKVLLLIPPARVRPDPKLGKVALGFSSIFWNTAWTARQPPHTLGVLCNPKDPLFAQFPTDYHSNWQWWYLIHNAGAMILDDLPPGLIPGVRVIDDWFTNRRLGLLFEAKVANGKLVVCSIDLDHETDPVRAQFRQSLFSYMASDRFGPRTVLEVEQVRGLMAEPSKMEKLGARVLKADSSEPGYEAEKAADGDASSFWHTQYVEAQPEFPHELLIELAKPARISGATVLPRQDGNPNGAIKGYAIYVSADGTSWGTPVAEGTFGPGAGIKKIQFKTAVECKFFKLVALSGHARGPWAAVAELDLIPEQ